MFLGLKVRHGSLSDRCGDETKNYAEKVLQSLLNFLVTTPQGLQHALLKEAAAISLVEGKPPRSPNSLSSTSHWKEAFNRADGTETLFAIGLDVVAVLRLQVPSHLSPEIPAIQIV